MNQVQDLTIPQRQRRQNVRNTYFAESPESILRGIEVFKSKNFDYSFEISCMFELLEEIKAEKNTALSG